MAADTVNKDLRITTRDDAKSIFEMEGVRYSEVGLTLPNNLPFEVWEEMMSTLGKIGRGIQWAIGDAINYGERKYGEVYSQAINLTGYNYNTLANFAWVARVFPPDKRREKLYFDHHSAVAWLYQHRPDVAEEILTLAETSEPTLSVKEVRNDVREAKRELGIDESTVPPSSEERSQRQRSGGIVINEQGEEVEAEWEDFGSPDTRTIPHATDKKGTPISSQASELRGLDEMMDELLDFVVRLAVARPPELLSLQQEAISWLHGRGLAGELHGRAG